MSRCDGLGCREYMELSRRQFLGATGAGIIAAGVPAWLPRVALASEFCAARDVIVSIFLRGAVDGLTMCVPYLESAYYAARPTLNIPQPDSGSPFAAIDLNGFFGIPPYMAPLLPAYQNGDLLFVHACGSTDTTRSHFDAMKVMEYANPNDPVIFSGWLGRHLMTSAPMVPGSILRAIGLNFGLQRTLHGAPDSLPIPKPNDFNLQGNAATRPARRSALTNLYQQTDDPLKTSAITTQATIDLLATINFNGYQSQGNTAYPNSPFGQSLKSSAALIRAEIGVEAIQIDIGGWDHHIEMGAREGILATKLTDLAAGLAAFHADMFAGNGKNVTVVVVSEFGRRIEENGNKGTDHGHGNAMIVLGNHIAGGRVLTNWPGLQPEQLFEGRDLQTTIDYRDILAEIIQHRLANSNLATVFPNFSPTFRGVTEACASPRGDMNCDGSISIDDVPGFSQAILDEDAFRAANASCDPLNADLNGDGEIDGRDIQEFTRRLLDQ